MPSAAIGPEARIAPPEHRSSAPARREPRVCKASVSARRRTADHAEVGREAAGDVSIIPTAMADEPARDALRSILARSAKLALLVVGLLIAGIAATAWLAGDASNLPFFYEGFD